MDSKRRLTIPATLAPVKAGDRFEALFHSDEGAIVFRRIGTNTDWLAVLKECPVSMEEIRPSRSEVLLRRKV